MTDAHHSFAFGPGILDNIASGVPAVFYIQVRYSSPHSSKRIGQLQARDTANMDRSTGGDTFSVRITRADAPPQAGAGGAKAAKAKGEQEQTVDPGLEASVKDEDNGRYLVTYTAPNPGKYKVGSLVASWKPLTN